MNGSDEAAPRRTRLPDLGEYSSSSPKSSGESRANRAIASSEYWHGGDPNRNRINLLRSFDQEAMKDRIKQLLQRPLAHGEAW
jgi:hypothetical protein